MAKRRKVTDRFEAKVALEAHRVIRNWMAFYATERPHSALENRTPREAYCADRNAQSTA